MQQVQKERLHPLILKVQSWIARHELLIVPGPQVVVGISGGPDSVALAHVLHTLGFPLHLAHLDHGLRPDSAQDAALVQSLAASWGCSITVEKANVRQYADEHGLSLEAAAREIRYRFLFQTARALHAQAVVVAHTQDDQAETVLLHLLRGSGLTGLQGMRPKNFFWDPAIPLVRPFLPVSRREVLAYCHAHSLPYREDPTNRDLRFTRNRIRHRLLPLLEQEFNPRVREALARLAYAVQQEMDVLMAEAQQAWEQVVETTGEGYLLWDVNRMRALPPGLRYHLWRRMVATLRPGLEMAFVDVERAEAWLKSPKSGPVDWFGGLCLALDPPARGITARWEADLPTAFWPQVLHPETPAPLPWGGRLALAHGWTLVAGHPQEASVLDEIDPRQRPPYEAWIDADTVANPLFVRGRRPGDRFAPLGMHGRTMKLSDFMINVKMPRRARDRWPLVLSEETIVWIPGYRVAHPFRVRPETRRVLRLRLVPPTSSPE